jgi:hypothetical protein
VVLKGSSRKILHGNVGGFSPCVYSVQPAHSSYLLTHHLGVGGLADDCLLISSPGAIEDNWNISGGFFLIITFSAETDIAEN